MILPEFLEPWLYAILKLLADSLQMKLLGTQNRQMKVEALAPGV